VPPPNVNGRLESGGEKKPAVAAEVVLGAVTVLRDVGAEGSIGVA